MELLRIPWTIQNKLTTTLYAVQHEVQPQYVCRCPISHCQTDMFGFVPWAGRLQTPVIRDQDESDDSSSSSSYCGAARWQLSYHFIHRGSPSIHRLVYFYSFAKRAGVSVQSGNREALQVGHQSGTGSLAPKGNLQFCLQLDCVSSERGGIVKESHMNKEGTWNSAQRGLTWLEFIFSLQLLAHVLGVTLTRPLCETGCLQWCSTKLCSIFHLIVSCLLSRSFIVLVKFNTINTTCPTTHGRHWKASHSVMGDRNRSSMEGVRSYSATPFLGTIQKRLIVFFFPFLCLGGRNFKVTRRFHVQRRAEKGKPNARGCGQEYVCGWSLVRVHGGTRETWQDLRNWKSQQVTKTGGLMRGKQRWGWRVEKQWEQRRSCSEHWDAAAGVEGKQAEEEHWEQGSDRCKTAVEGKKKMITMGTMTKISMQDSSSAIHWYSRSYECLRSGKGLCQE